MESLMSYGDQNSDEDEEVEEEPVSDDVITTGTSNNNNNNNKSFNLDNVAAEKTDRTAGTINNFFGFDNSDDDGDDDVVVVYGGATIVGSPLTAVDTLISAYQLVAATSGPDLLRRRGDTKAAAAAADVIDLPLPPTKKCRRAINRSTTDRRHHQLEIEPTAHGPADDIDSRPIPLSKNGPDIFVAEPRAVARWRDRLSSSSSSSLPRRPKRRLIGHAKCVNTLQWGRVESECTHLLLSASMDGCLRIWNTMSGLCVWNRAMSQPDTAAGLAAVRCARWCHDGRTVACGGYDRTARVVDVETDKELFVAAHKSYVTCLRFHPRERRLLVCGNAGRVDCWDTRSPPAERAALVRSYSGDFGEVQDLEFLPGGSEMLTCTNTVTRDSADRTIMAWDFAAAAVLSNQIYNERYHCTCLRVHPGEKHFLAQSNGNYVAMFSVVRPYKMDKKRRFEGHKVDGYWVGLGNSADGRFVYSGSSDGRLHGYDFKTSASVGRWRVSEHALLAVECHPLLDTTVAISDTKGDVHIWE